MAPSVRELASSARVTSGSGNASHRSSLTSLRKLPWRDELLPRAAAAAGAVVILALAWHLAGGLSRVQVDAGAQPQRMRVGFVTRPADPVVPPPVSLPPAQASVPGGRTPALPAPSDAQALLPATAAVVATPAVPGAPGLFDEDGRPRLPDGRSDRWNRPAAAVPGSTSAGSADTEARRRLLERRNPVQVQGTRFAGTWRTDGDAADVVAQEIIRAQNKIAEFLFGKEIEHARARPSPQVRFHPGRHERGADLGSEATGDAYKAAPISYEPAPGLDGQASRRIREQVAALETAYAGCDRARLRALMQPLLLHLDELQKAETAHARGADPVHAQHRLPNVANNAWDMSRRALWYADSKMAGCGG